MVRASRWRTYSASHVASLVRDAKVAQRFHDDAQLANRYVLAKEQMQHLLNFADFHQTGNQFVDDGGRNFFQFIDQVFRRVSG